MKPTGTVSTSTVSRGSPRIRRDEGVAPVLVALGGSRDDGLLMALGMTAGVGSLAFSAIVIAGLVKIGSQVVAPLHF
ncbi:hypothetical protein WKW80_32535 [Variovorax humicola]|uniref:Uncharacterized protein n=1 Tax=Variovorax humicola TaxID=1769758 RepID=A0ABU8W9R5_9BURK